MTSARRRIAWFIAVGCAAAAVHFSVAVGLVEALGAAPLRANIVGWLIAFVVSFAGHRRLTFAAQRAPFARSAGRFFLVSGAGFAINQASYAALPGWTGLHYGVALATVLIGVALLTYWLGRHWAFLGSRVR